MPAARLHKNSPTHRSTGKRTSTQVRAAQRSPVERCTAQHRERPSQHGTTRRQGKGSKMGGIRWLDHFSTGDKPTSLTVNTPVCPPQTQQCQLDCCHDMFQGEKKCWLFPPLRSRISSNCWAGGSWFCCLGNMDINGGAPQLSGNLYFWPKCIWSIFYETHFLMILFMRHRSPQGQLVTSWHLGFLGTYI